MGRLFEAAIRRSERGRPAASHARIARATAAWPRAILVLTIGLASQACLVVTMQPAFDDESIVVDDRIVGAWRSEDDETRVTIARDEWRSYRIEYAHPIETGVLTGYLSSIGGTVYMDVMPARGRDHGAFVVPMHAVVRLKILEDRMELTPLAYDAFLDAARTRAPRPGLAFVMDQKQYAVVSASTAELRRWLAAQGTAPRWSGPTTTFRRLTADALEYGPGMPHN